MAAIGLAEPIRSKPASRMGSGAARARVSNPRNYNKTEESIFAKPSREDLKAFHSSLRVPDIHGAKTVESPLNKEIQKSKEKIQAARKALENIHNIYYLQASDKASIYETALKNALHAIAKIPDDGKGKPLTLAKDRLFAELIEAFSSNQHELDQPALKRLVKEFRQVLGKAFRINY